MSLPADRRHAVDLLKVRRNAHRRLDELLDWYEDGHQLHLRTEHGWTTSRVDDELVIVIRQRPM